jgi:tellurite resistance protein TerC
LGHHSPLVWTTFAVGVISLLTLDLFVIGRRSRSLRFGEALAWSIGWVSLALLFGLFLLVREGAQPALEYYAGYVIELSLSADNLFVFLVVFQYFAVPAELRPRVLKWGIMGAVVMRAIMVVAGAVLIARFEWVIYVFGVIVILTGIRMMRHEMDRIEPEKNPVVRLARRLFPFTSAYEGEHFFVRTHAGWRATPLVLVLLVVESTDLVFAVDSIPAIFAVTRDPFIVYSSNVFAILGLRALFFVLAGMMDRFRYLKPAVAAILVFVGVKMLLGHYVDVPVVVSLGIILTTLALGVAVSLLKTAGAEPRSEP